MNALFKSINTKKTKKTDCIQECNNTYIITLQNLLRSSQMGEDIDLTFEKTEKTLDTCLKKCTRIYQGRKNVMQKINWKQY